MDGIGLIEKRGGKVTQSIVGALYDYIYTTCVLYKYNVRQR